MFIDLVYAGSEQRAAPPLLRQDGVMTLRWKENPAVHLISHQIISDDEREKLFEAAELAKKMGVYKGKASVDKWHDRQEDHDEEVRRRK